MADSIRRNSVLDNPDAYKSWTMPVVGQAVVKPSRNDDLMDDIKKIKADAYQEAYAAGRAQAQTEIDEEKRRLQDSTQLIVFPLEMVDEGLKQLLTDCIVLLTEQCLCAELSLDKNKIKLIVDTVIAQLDEKSLETKVYLHPQDLQTLKDNLVDGQLVANMQADANLSIGETKVETIHCSIDATVRNRLRSACFDILMQNGSESA